MSKKKEKKVKEVDLEKILEKLSTEKLNEIKGVYGGGGNSVFYRTGDFPPKR